MNIEVHIERLILDGVNILPSQRHPVRASIRNRTCPAIHEQADYRPASRKASPCRMSP